MSELEFERQQLEHIIGKVGYTITEGQDTGSQITFKIKKAKAHYTNTKA